MKTPLVLLLALSLALPLAAAVRPDVPDFRGDHVTVGPCIVGWSMLWPGETVGVRCTAAGQTVGASYGTCSLGNYVLVYVNGAYRVGCGATWLDALA